MKTEQELRAHIDKLVEIFDAAVPCSDKCQLAGILAWVDPADFQRVRELRTELHEENVILKEANEELATALELASPGGNTIESQAASFINEAIDLIKEHEKLKKTVHELRGGSLQGHEEKCALCENPCSVFAGDPSDWPIPMIPVDGEPGVPKWHHIGCVREQLVHASTNEKMLKLMTELSELNLELSQKKTEKIEALRAAVADAARVYVERDVLMCGICDKPVTVCDDMSPASGFDPLLDKVCPGHIMRRAFAASA